MSKEKRVYIKTEWTNKKAIYKIVNKINGKFYLGSSVNLGKRIWQHKKDLRLGIHCNIHLQNSYNVHGVKSFDYEIWESIPDDASEEIVQAIEQTYLDKYYDGCVNCYNISKIADRPDSELNKKPVNQIDKKTGEIIKEWSGAEEAMDSLGICGISQACKGKRASVGGFKWKYADTELARIFPENNSPHGGRGKRKVVEIDKISGNIIEKYESLAEAEQKTGIKYTTIISVCAGRRQSVGERIFRYEEQSTLTNNKKHVCLECSNTADVVQITFNSVRQLATHIQYYHKMKSKDYIIKHFYAGIEPKCVVESCDNVPRYTSMNGVESFKTYCAGHASLACSIAGKEGGKNKKSWNKGLTKATDIRIHNQSLAVSGEGNHFFGKSHTDGMKSNMSKLKTLTQEEYDTRINLRAGDFKCLTPYSAYVSRQKTRLNLECVKCSKAQQKTLQAFERGGLCKYCYPFMVSKGEIAIGEYVESLGFSIKRNDRTIIGPKELDICVTDKKFAIEYNGLYWHDEQKVGKRHHIDKTEACTLVGYNLFHIYSDEWEYKTDIVKSMISNRLHASNVQNIDARKCIIEELTGKEASAFFEATHISGTTAASKYFALKYKDEIVSVMSWRHPQQKKKWREANPNCIEMARYSNKLFANVRGGFSRLLKYSILSWVIPSTNYKTILSYCDLRFGQGNVYIQNGFTLDKSNTGINYWYTDGKVRYPRFKFRATKDKTEKQVATDNKVWKVFGCSNASYKLTLD